MTRRNKKENIFLTPTPSLLSISSSADLSIKEETLPNPATLDECDDLLETYHLLLQGKSKEKASMITHIKELRADKEPLLKVKSTIQEEILSANHLINVKSEEVTQLRQKLRHHSEKQIYDNIDRLEVQLRNNNYRPREEQKILDEICMLKRSFKTLREFELKQKENKKLRSERSRLIDQRNEVFSKLQAIFLQEEEMKKEVKEMKHIINTTMKTVDHLKALRPDLEKAHYLELKQKEEIKQKRMKEKMRAKKEQYILRQQERQKRWEEYEASREPYQDEKDICRMLLAYLQSTLPKALVKAKSASEKDSQKEILANQNSMASTKEKSNDSNCSGLDSRARSCPSSLFCFAEKDASPSFRTPGSPLASQGSFYFKPQDEPLQESSSKRRKAKARKELKAAGKVRGLSHPPDVILNLDFLKVFIPRTTADVHSCISQVEKKLEHFTLLGEAEKKGFLNGDAAKGNEDKSQSNLAVESHQDKKIQECQNNRIFEVQEKKALEDQGKKMPESQDKETSESRGKMTPMCDHKKKMPEGHQNEKTPEGQQNKRAPENKKTLECQAKKTPEDKSLPSPIENSVLTTSVMTNGFSPPQKESNLLPTFPSFATAPSHLISDLTNPKSFFSIPLPVVRGEQPKKDPSFVPTYASVTAKVHI